MGVKREEIAKFVYKVGLIWLVFAIVDWLLLNDSSTGILQRKTDILPYLFALWGYLFVFISAKVARKNSSGVSENIAIALRLAICFGTMILLTVFLVVTKKIAINIYAVIEIAIIAVCTVVFFVRSLPKKNESIDATSARAGQINVAYIEELKINIKVMFLGMVAAFAVEEAINSNSIKDVCIIVVVLGTICYFICRLICKTFDKAIKSA